MRACPSVLPPGKVGILNRQTRKLGRLTGVTRRKTVIQCFQLAREYPGRRFTLLIGSDAAQQIRSWHDADALLDEGSFVIFNRPETALAPQTLHELGFAPARTRIVHLDTPAIAAHQVRDRLARGAPIDDLVPAAVADYIRSHDLYRGNAASGQ